MRIGIMGGTGFIGSHLVRRLASEGHQIVVVSRSGNERNEDIRELPQTEFFAASVSDRAALRDAFSDCDRVAHLAGINVERGSQTYETVHVQGTENVVDAAEEAGVTKIILSSFLRARPASGSAYHESKWESEQIVRNSALDYTVFKPGVTYGRGDHMLEHLSRALATVPVFGSIGLTERRLRPLAIEDLVDCMVASLADDRLENITVGVVGPEELTLSELVRRTGEVLGREPLVIPLPVLFHYAFAWVQERVMEVPITTVGQVRILAEGATEPAPKEVCKPLPADLEPTHPFSRERIKDGITTQQPYGFGDLRW